MKTRLSTTLLIPLALSCLCAATAREVTLQLNWPDPPQRPTDEVAIGANEVAEITCWLGGGNKIVELIKDGITNSISNPLAVAPMRVAGPAVLRASAAVLPGTSCRFLMTVRIEPESFPPGQTLILPAGTVGIVHAQSSTNLLEWKDEWVHTFSNTNDNRFFRLSAERSSP